MLRFGSINVFDSLQKGNLINPISASPVARFNPRWCSCLQSEALHPLLENKNEQDLRASFSLVPQLGLDE